MAQNLKFPQGFLWGTATSAYQVEGGIKNDWWALAYKKKPVEILGKKINLPKAGKACDHYNRYEEDFDLAKSLHQNAYRFSIEWARLEPIEGKFDLKELSHYRKMIQALKKRGMVPFVTLHHFTNPVWFHKKGSWLNRQSPEIFSRYVEFVIKNINEEVKFWITINEPDLYASFYPALKKAYTGTKTPDVLDLLYTIRNLIKAHKKAYQILHQFGPTGVQVGAAHNNPYFDGQPKLIVNFAKWLWNRVFIIDRLHGYQDFIGLNYYFHKRLKISWSNPARWFDRTENKKVSDMNWEIYPSGIYHVLQELKRYRKPVYITENGLADKNDCYRAEFIKEHLCRVYQAIREGVDVRGYFHWSLMDNFEWDKGFWPRFGLIEIDYQTLERKIRPSAFYYAKICKENAIECG